MNPNDTPEPNLMRALGSLLPKSDPTPQLPPVLPEPIGWKSIAWWPYPAVMLYDKENMSDDKHHDEESARAVCRRLEREGFGGEKKIFPLNTAVEPIYPDPPIALANGIGVEPTSDPCESEAKPESEIGCPASGAGCSSGPHGPNGEIQCRYCGLPTPQPSGAWDRSDYVRMYEKQSKELSQANAAVGRLRSLLESVQQASIDPMGIEMAKVMGEIYRELDTPPAPDGWRPIETAPKDGRTMALLCKGEFAPGKPFKPFCGFYDGRHWTRTDGDSGFYPDLWSPLPKPPTGKERP